jgi:GMP synthase-like glutamine amidotransferase
VKPVIVVQHLEPEGPYEIASRFVQAGHDVRIVRTDRGDRVPQDVSEMSALVVMGGPMSATSDDGFPTRQAELALLHRALDARLPVLAVCLGGQMLAEAAGGEVHRGDGAEIGWAPVELTDDALMDPLFGGLPTRFEVLHWHEETFRLPPDAVHLARSDRYEQQAFRVGDRAWGLQFHVEIDLVAVEAFVGSFPDDAKLAPGGADGIRRDSRVALTSLAATQRELLDRFVRQAETEARGTGPVGGGRRPG